MDNRQEKVSKLLNLDESSRLISDLTDALEAVNDQLGYDLDSNDYLCLVVLEDDICSLLDEYSQWHDMCEFMTEMLFESFEDRSITILDEVSLLVSNGMVFECLC